MLCRYMRTLGFIEYTLLLQMSAAAFGAYTSILALVAPYRPPARAGHNLRQLIFDAGNHSI